MYFETNNSLLGTKSFLRETRNVFHDTNNSLLGTKYFLRETRNVFRDTSNSLLGTKYFLRETNNVFQAASNSLLGTEYFLRETRNVIPGASNFLVTKYHLEIPILTREFNHSEVAFKNTLTDRACRNIMSVCKGTSVRAVSELTTVDNCVNDCESITSSNHEQTPSACVQTGRHRAISQLKHARIRDREPSRLSRRTVKRIVGYLRCTKLGRKNQSISTSVISFTQNLCEFSRMVCSLYPQTR